MGRYRPQIQWAAFGLAAPVLSYCSGIGLPPAPRSFLLCRECGVYLGAQLSSDGARFGILNTLTLNPVPADLRSPEAMNYGGETAESRRARRVARWTPLERDSI
jgi:hypothetical protein